ncbi:MAG: protoheme IX farnesyltransferase [Pirellulales bacterium]|nr:protoheme IX farnesyltransferase [Pirellulales bacterium]
MSIPMSTAVCTTSRSTIVTRLGDYLELCKPRIVTLLLVVVAVAAYVGGWGPPPPWTLFHSLVGTAMIAASASAFNQWIERHRDALMPRTADRPLPAGRLSGQQTIAFGAVALTFGVVYLGYFVNFATTLWGLITWLIYVTVYTPMKVRSPANTAVGAVAGALPVMIGWSAVEASFSLTAGPVSGGVRVAALFLIVYLWQFPHFMAIAWIYRRQYGAAGMQMLTVVDPTGRRAGLQAVLGSLALFPISVLPALQLAGRTYIVGAITLGAMYLVTAAMFSWQRSDHTARRLLRASLVYLPVLLVLLIVSPRTEQIDAGSLSAADKGLRPIATTDNEQLTLDRSPNHSTPDI